MFVIARLKLDRKAGTKLLCSTQYTSLLFQRVIIIALVAALSFQSLMLKQLHCTDMPRCLDSDVTENARQLPRRSRTLQMQLPSNASRLPYRKQDIHNKRIYAAYTTLRLETLTP